MPIQHALWRVGTKPEILNVSRLPSEQMLEDMIVRDPRILSSEWMLIGRQERTSESGRIDLLAVAPDGSLVLIELKRDRTPRDIVAQALDYAEWVSRLTADRIAQIYSRFSEGRNLDADFLARFGFALDEDTLNQSHQIILVASELDPATERIVGYLNERDIAINVLFFQVFQLGAEQLLSRAWMIDPGETQMNAVQTIVTKTGKANEPWNGEFYVSYGGSGHRVWGEARKYGFISGGGGAWYSQTLRLLNPGDRIWVKIPGTGFVGVGVVLETCVPITQFLVNTERGERPALEVLQHAEIFRQRAENPELTEYFVRVKWLDTRDEANAFDEVGLFGNQNTVCRPKAPVWRHTVDRLKTVFTNWENAQGT